MPSDNDCFVVIYICANNGLYHGQTNFQMLIGGGAFAFGI